MEESHPYNKGINTVYVVSKVPLPNYRADLDQKHGSSQREVWSVGGRDTLTMLLSLKFICECSCLIYLFSISFFTDTDVG